MPKLNNTPELQAEALARKRERDKIAQANWVARNKDLHLARMKEQYQKKKVAKVVEEKPVPEVQPANTLKNGVVDNSTLADAIKNIKDNYIRIVLWKKHGETPTAEQKADFMSKLVLPADLIIKNKSKLTPAHLTAITELGKDLTTILHHEFAKKTRKLRV